MLLVFYFSLNALLLVQIALKQSVVQIDLCQLLNTACADSAVI